jgi:acyl carrier protein
MDHNVARTLIAQHLGVKVAAVTDDAVFVTDLGADSLDLLELTMQFEDALNIAVTELESEHCTRVIDALELLDRKIRCSIPISP